MNPSDQLADIRDNATSKANYKLELSKAFIDDDVMQIMEKSTKTYDDFRSFLLARERLIHNEIKERWNFEADSEFEADDDETI